MSLIQKFIIIDDDHFNNALSRMAIKKTLGEVDTKIFSEPEDGLAFLQRDCNGDATPAILFLDINMPALSGWKFMEQFEKLNQAIKDQITVYMLSSSVDQRDMDKAEGSKYIKGFISKPLKRETILFITRV